MAQVEIVGEAPDGEVWAVTLRGARGLRAKVMSHGARLTELWVPDAEGNLADIVLGHDRLEDWLASSFYFGVTCGRYANRIGGARFSLNGRDIRLTANEGANQLHGGPEGFSHRNWRLTGYGERYALFHLSSPDGDMGFPGQLEVDCCYRIDEENRLWIEMTAECDAPTIVNLAHHSYFNLAGHDSGTVLDQMIRIEAEHMTPVDDALIPTGELMPVAGTPFDLRQLRRIGELMPGAKGYDHNFCLSTPLDESWGRRLRPCAEALDPASGRRMRLATNQPGLQFYTGGYLDGRLPGKAGAEVSPFAGFALETQNYPDAPNKPHFPSPRLEPRQVYRHLMAFDFSPAG